MKSKTLYNLKRLAKAIIISPILLPYALLLLILAFILTGIEIAYDRLDEWARNQIDSEDSVLNRMANWINI